MPEFVSGANPASAFVGMFQDPTNRWFMLYLAISLAIGCVVFYFEARHDPQLQEQGLLRYLFPQENLHPPLGRRRLLVFHRQQAFVRAGFRRARGGELVIGRGGEPGLARRRAFARAQRAFLRRDFHHHARLGAGHGFRPVVRALFVPQGPSPVGVPQGASFGRGPHAADRRSGASSRRCAQHSPLGHIRRYRFGALPIPVWIAGADIRRDAAQRARGDLLFLRLSSAPFAYLASLQGSLGQAFRLARTPPASSLHRRAPLGQESGFRFRHLGLVLRHPLRRRPAGGGPDRHEWRRGGRIPLRSCHVSSALRESLAAASASKARGVLRPRICRRQSSGASPFRLAAARLPSRSAYPSWKPIRSRTRHKAPRQDARARRGQAR